MLDRMLYLTLTLFQFGTELIDQNVFPTTCYIKHRFLQKFNLSDPCWILPFFPLYFFYTWHKTAVLFLWFLKCCRAPCLSKGVLLSLFICNIGILVWQIYLQRAAVHLAKLFSSVSLPWTFVSARFLFLLQFRKGTSGFQKRLPLAFRKVLILVIRRMLKISYYSYQFLISEAQQINPVIQL